MNSRTYIAGFLVFSCLVIPLVQLSFGFRYVDYPDSCPGQQDIMLLMAIGGFFEIIAFALSFRCIYDLAPSKYKETKSKPSGEINSKESQRAQKILICCITAILLSCALIFFVLIQYRVYSNFNRIQWSNSTATNYCRFEIYSSAFGLMISTYVAIFLLLTFAIIFFFGFCSPKN